MAAQDIKDLNNRAQTAEDLIKSFQNSLGLLQSQLSSQSILNIDEKQQAIKIQDRSNIIIREMKDNEVEKANKIAQNAFYGFFKRIELLELCVVAPRLYYPEIWVVEYKNDLIGLGMAVHYGSIRVWGPICILTKYQKNGIGTMLINHMNNSLKLSNIDPQNKVKIDMLFTHLHTHHLPFYMSIGFLPKCITWITKYDLNINNKYNNKLNQIIQNNVNQFRFTAADCIDDKLLFINQCRLLTNSLYNGMDLTVEINGYNKYDDIGSCYGLFNINNNKLFGFAICCFGKFGECPKNGMKIKFAAANDYNSLCVLLYHIIKTAKQKNLVTIQAGINVARINAFEIMTKLFKFEYNATKPDISMGKTIDINEEYDDYNKPNSFVVGDCR